MKTNERLREDDQSFGCFLSGETECSFLGRDLNPWLWDLLHHLDLTYPKIAQWLAHLLPDPAAQVRFPASLNFLEEKSVNFAELNQQRCLEESRQWLENVDRTHLVFAKGKIGLQKDTFTPSISLHL